MIYLLLSRFANCSRDPKEAPRPWHIVKEQAVTQTGALVETTGRTVCGIQFRDRRREGAARGRVRFRERPPKGERICRVCGRRPAHPEPGEERNQ